MNNDFQKLFVTKNNNPKIRNAEDGKEIQESAGRIKRSVARFDLKFY